MGFSSLTSMGRRQGSLTINLFVPTRDGGGGGEGRAKPALALPHCHVQDIARRPTQLSHIVGKWNFTFSQLFFITAIVILVGDWCLNHASFTNQCVDIRSVVLVVLYGVKKFVIWLSFLQYVFSFYFIWLNLFWLVMLKNLIFSRDKHSIFQTNKWSSEIVPAAFKLPNPCLCFIW